MWFKHQWEMDNFVNMRQLFCEVYTDEDPNAVEKCGAPLSWRPLVHEQIQYHGLWRFSRQGHIRGSGLLPHPESSPGHHLRHFCGLCSIVVALCHRIITDEVLTKSMNEFMNVLLLIPVATCGGLAFYLWWLNDYTATELEYFWLANSFLYTAIAQVVALPLGFFAGRLKSKWMLQVYIFLMLGVLTAMILNGAICIIFAGILEEVFVPTTSEFGDIACNKNLVGCCCCDYTEAVASRCPEWENEEIMSLLVLDLKISGIAALGSALYPVGALIIAVMTRAALANYKVDYIGVGKVLSEEVKADEQEGQENLGGGDDGGGTMAIAGPRAGYGGFVPSISTATSDVDVALSPPTSGSSPFSGVHFSPKGGSDSGTDTSVLQKSGLRALFGNVDKDKDKDKGKGKGKGGLGSTGSSVDDLSSATMGSMRSAKARAGSVDSLYSAQGGVDALKP